MKDILIIENAPSLCEGKVEDGDTLYIEGIIAQSEIKNRNGRFYPKGVLEEAVKHYNEEFVNKNIALGELNHPPRPMADPAHATHRITEMKMQGNDVWAKAIVLEDATKLRALIKSGWQVQASTRGLGALREVKGGSINETYNEVTKYKMTVGFDVVQGQSAPNALMDGVYEDCAGLYESDSTGNYNLIGDKKEAETNENWDLVFDKLSRFVG